MSWMSAIPLALLLGLFALPGGEEFAEGVQHFREGRYEKSYALLRDVEKAHGDEKLPAALLVDLALAASKTGRFDEAEGYAEQVAARDAGLGYLRDQVVGAARYDAARKAAIAAEAPDPKNAGTPIPGTPIPGTPMPGTPNPGTPNPGPKGLDIKKLDEALTLVRRAIDSFGSAIMASPASLEPRRNLERALKLEKELEKKKKEAEDKKKKDDQKKKDDKDKDEKKKKDDKKKEDEKGKEDKGKKDENKDEKKQDKKDDKKGEGDQKKPEKSDPKDKPVDQPLKQLSPEEKKRLEKVLEDYQKALVELKKSRAPKHQPGKKDW